jgi:hypothetical protein
MWSSPVLPLQATAFALEVKVAPIRQKCRPGVVISFQDGSIFLTGDGEPPAWDTRSKPAHINPFQSPGNSFTPKARNRLSGDQNGPAMAPSLPGKGRASSASRERTHSRAQPSGPGASNAMRRPASDALAAPAARADNGRAAEASSTVGST